MGSSHSKGKGKALVPSEAWCNRFLAPGKHYPVNGGFVGRPKVDQGQTQLVPFPKTARPSMHRRDNHCLEGRRLQPPSYQHGDSRHRHHEISPQQQGSHPHGGFRQNQSKDHHTSSHRRKQSHPHRSSHRQANSYHQHHGRSHSDGKSSSNRYESRDIPFQGQSDYDRSGFGTGVGAGRRNVTDIELSIGHGHRHAGRHRQHHQHLEPIDELARSDLDQDRHRSSRR